MKNKMYWRPPPASSSWELMDLLHFAASGLKSQIIASPILATSGLNEVRARLLDIADELNGLQKDVGEKNN